MRRRLEIFIPIVLLAVLVQLIAPIAAFRVVADAVSDPLYMASICSGMTASADASQPDSAPVQHVVRCCVFFSLGAAVALIWRRSIPDLRGTDIAPRPDTEPMNILNAPS